MNNPWEELKGAPKPTESKKPISFVQQPVASHASAQSQSPGVTAPGVTKLVETANASSFSPPPIVATSSGNRGGAWFLVAIGAGITIFDWYLRNTQNVYYVKLAVIGPICAVLGLVGLMFPSSLDKQTDDSIGKIARIVAIVLGLAAGGLNWYLLAN